MAKRHSMFRPHERRGIEFGDVSRTRQEFMAECDINQIMKKYEKTGVISHVNRTQARYVDFSVAPDFQTALNLLQDASDAFARLPASVRKRFGNDPREFVAFAEKPESLDELRSMGLAPPAPPAPTPTKVEGVNPPSEPAEAAEGGSKAKK